MSRISGLHYNRGASGTLDHRFSYTILSKSNSVTQRVLFISPQPFFAWRGSSIRVKFNVLALTELGYQVDLLTIPIGEEESTPANVIRVPNFFGSKSISIGPSVLKLWFDLLLFIYGIGLVIRHRYIVVHGTEETGFLAWILSKFGRCRSVYEKHSDAASYQKGALQNFILKAYLAVEHFTCRHADLVICTGPGLYRQALDIAPKAKCHDIFDIPSSLVEPKESEISAAREMMTNGAKQDAVLVNYVGSFAVYQGIDIIFEAIPRVVSQNVDIRFIIIGGSESEIVARKKQLEAAGVPDQSVFFLGLIPPDQLPAYLNASDILLAPRKAGVNTPLKVLDYFKAGGAIVATDTAANRLILDHECARLCDFDAIAFSDTILELARNKETREGLATMARSKYLDKFNFRVFTRLLGEAYEDMIDVGPTNPRSAN